MKIIVAGDVVNIFPDSKRCWDLVMSLKCPVLRGNHERYLFDLRYAERSPQLGDGALSTAGLDAAAVQRAGFGNDA